MLVFDLIVNTVLLGMTAVAIVAVLGPRATPGLALILLGSAAVPSVMLGSVLVVHDTFAAMRAAAWALFVWLPLWCLLLAVHGTVRRPLPDPEPPQPLPPRLFLGLVALAIVAVGVDAFFIEPSWLVITRHRLVSDKVDEPLLIAVLSDMQTDDPGEYERLALRTALDAGPDLVLLPGDYVQDYRGDVNAELRARMRELLIEAGLDAPLGVYAVRGNVEHPGWTEIFADLPVEAHDETRVFHKGPVSVTALSFRDGFDPRTVVPAQPGLHIAVAHAPDFALGEVDADLLVAGHTHGGQVQLPLIGPLITYSLVPRSWAAGLTALDGGGTLLVSRGIGMERDFAPRLRFLCRPEVVLVEVVPAHPAAPRTP